MSEADQPHSSGTSSPAPTGSEKSGLMGILQSMFRGPKPSASPALATPALVSPPKVAKPEAPAASPEEAASPAPPAEVPRTKGESRFLRTFKSKGVGGEGEIPAETKSSAAAQPPPVPTTPVAVPQPVIAPKEDPKTPPPGPAVPPPPPVVAATIPTVPVASASAPVSPPSPPLTKTVPAEAKEAPRTPTPPPPPLLRTAEVPVLPPATPPATPAAPAPTSLKASAPEIAPVSPVAPAAAESGPVSAKARFLAKHGRRPLPPAPPAPPALTAAPHKPAEPPAPVAKQESVPTPAQKPPKQEAKPEVKSSAPAPIPKFLQPPEIKRVPAPPSVPPPPPVVEKGTDRTPPPPLAPQIHAPESGRRGGKPGSGAESTAREPRREGPAGTASEVRPAPSAPPASNPPSKEAEKITPAVAPVPSVETAPPGAAGMASSSDTAAGLRERRRARIAMAPMPSGPPRRNWKTPLAIIGILCFVGAAAFAIYYYTRETVLEVRVSASDFQIQPRAYVVFNFAGKTSMLQRDFRTRQAPLLEQLDVQQEQLNSAKGDQAGRQQRRDLLQDSMDQLQKEIPQMLERSQKELDRFWEQEGKALREQYASTREGIHQEIIARAQQLGINYQRNTELDAIEVAANAFRLALYNAPSGVVVDEERKWTEGLLKKWNEFEKDWNARQLELKDKAMEIKQAPGPKVEAAQERINQLRLEIDAMDVELKSLADEVKTYEERLVEARQALEDTVAPFLRELLNVPGEFEKMTLELPGDGPLVVRDLQERADLPPGRYTLLVRGLRKEEEHWAVKDFEILEFKKNAIDVVSGDFKPAREYLIPSVK